MQHFCRRGPLLFNNVQFTLQGKVTTHLAHQSKVQQNWRSRSIKCTVSPVNVQGLNDYQLFLKAESQACGRSCNVGCNIARTVKHDLGMRVVLFGFNYLAPHPPRGKYIILLWPHATSSQHFCLQRHRNLKFSLQPEVMLLMHLADNSHTEEFFNRVTNQHNQHSLQNKGLLCIFRKGKHINFIQPIIHPPPPNNAKVAVR